MLRIRHGLRRERWRRDLRCLPGLRVRVRGPGCSDVPARKTAPRGGFLEELVKLTANGRRRLREDLPEVFLSPSLAPAQKWMKLFLSSALPELVLF